MRFTDVIIQAVACELPPHVVTSNDIEQRLKPLYDRLRLPYGRLEMMSGIHERRFWDRGTRSSEAAALAGRKAIQLADIDPERIGCLIHASVCRDFMEPATASIVHEKLDLPPPCMIYDLSNACLGVINGMAMVAHMIQLGHIEAGLVVSGETAEALHEATIEEVLATKRITRADFKRHFASLTIGSGAAAVLLTHADVATTNHRLLGGAVRTDSKANTLCRGGVDRNTANGGPLMDTDSEGLLRAGCRLASQSWEALKATLDWTNDSPDHFFTHQVGVVHRNMIFETLQIDTEKDFPTVNFTGNTGSAALPMAFALGIDRKEMHDGEKIALLGIGSGLSSLLLGVEW